MTIKQIPVKFHKDTPVHLSTGYKWPPIRIRSRITYWHTTAIGIEIEFLDFCKRVRREVIPYDVFTSFPKFFQKMSHYGYKLGPDKLAKELHQALTQKSIPKLIVHFPAGGWWSDHLRTKYLQLGKEVKIAPSISLLFDNEDRLSQKTQSNPQSLEMARLSAHSPVLMIAQLSALAGIAMGMIEQPESFAIYIATESPVVRKLIRQVAAAVGTRCENCWATEISSSFDLVANHRHNVLCVDIPSGFDPLRVKDALRSLMRGGGKIKSRSGRRPPLPDDMRLIVLATGSYNHFGNLPRAISVSAIVDPELGIFDSLGDFKSPGELMFALQKSARSGGALPAFARQLAIRSIPSRVAIREGIHRFVKDMCPKTEEERQQAQAIGLLEATGLLAIKWGLLPWDPDGLRSVLRKLYRDASHSTPDPEEPILDQLRKCLLEAEWCLLRVQGNKRMYSDQRAQEAEVYIRDDGLYVLGRILAEWLPGEQSAIALGALEKRKYLIHPHIESENPVTGGKKTVQIRILGPKKHCYAIAPSFLGEAGQAKLRALIVEGAEDNLGQRRSEAGTGPPANPQGDPPRQDAGSPDPEQHRLDEQQPSRNPETR